MSTSPPRATIVITSRNRKDELRVAVASALKQNVPVEVLVIDDGSTDGTSEMIRGEFPAAKLHRDEQPKGLIVQRNNAARLASAPVVVSIDDDAEMPSERTVEQTLAEFDHPRVGAVAIPFINVRLDDTVRQRAPDDKDVYVAPLYWGTAHALRRDVFLRLGGYREVLFHQGEEMDYCIRMLGAGYVVRLGTADPIHHFVSPKRDVERQYIYESRNTLLYAWHNVPTGRLPAQWAGSVFNLLRHGVRRRHPVWVLRGLARGFGISALEFSRRRPVDPGVYALSRLLRRRQCVPIGEIVDQLPEPEPAPPTGRAAQHA